MLLSKIKSYLKLKINYILKYLRYLCGLFIILCFFLSIKFKSSPSLNHEMTQKNQQNFAGFLFEYLAVLFTTSFFNFRLDRKSTRLNSSHVRISYAVFCLKKKKT